MVEAQLQKKIQAAVKAAGGFSRKVNSESQKGFPDLVVILDGVVVFVEVKGFRGRTTQLQTITHELIREAGGVVEIWREVKDAERFIQRATSSD